MFSDKKNILQLVALLKAHEIRNIVLCPGSRNTPLIQTIANHPYFTCHSATDERSAGFYALGLSLNGGKPAAVCCTSGTALLNLHPAVAEAFYQQVPLVVISADRPEAWIGQMDGQTLPQPGVFGNLVKMSVNLPEINTDEEEWFCNRLVNEALLELNHHGKGPVHINIPISEPLFSFNTEELPEVRVIERYQGLNIYDKKYDDLIARLNKYNRRMMIAGQANMIYMFERKVSKLLYKHFAWLTEHTGNRTIPGMPIKNFDAILYSIPEGSEEQEKFYPEIVITYGGHIVSKRLKQFLRKHPPKEHWHVSLDGKVTDTYCSVTTIIEIDPFEFLDKLAYMMENRNTDYPKRWENLSKEIPEPQFPFSEMGAIGALLKNIPADSALHLANSSTVRYAQLFNIPETVEVCCNRGTSGIEGSLSTSLGYAYMSEKINFTVIGDLSFFYDMNALWSGTFNNNVRIMLLNNGGGEIFQALPGLKMNDKTHRYVTARHNTNAEAWAKACGFTYLSARNDEELESAIKVFADSKESASPMFLEVFTDKAKDVELLKEYYHSLKKQIK